MAELDLERVTRSMVRLRAEVPEDAFTAGVLGSQRIGNGIVINDDGLVLTIGYLVTEARDVWLTTADGREIAGHPLAYDQVTGFGLVIPLQSLALPSLPVGMSSALESGDHAYAVSFREFGEPQPVRIFARREFAGYWEYLLEDAIFATPAHPHWSGAALLDTEGHLVGVGSLLTREVVNAEEVNANMYVPIDLLKPILEDMCKLGRVTRESRPWLGVYAVEMTGSIYVTGVAEGSPAAKADLREGDLISRVAGQEVATLPDFYRRLWSIGPAGTGVPLTAIRGGTRLQVNVRSVDRTELLKRPQAN